MTVFIASLFLPYTVQFEVDKEHAEALEDNKSMGDILEIVEKPARSQSGTSTSMPVMTPLTKSATHFPYQTEKDVSIIDSLVNNMAIDDGDRITIGSDQLTPILKTGETNFPHDADADTDDLSSISSNESELVNQRIHSLHSGKVSRNSTPQNLSVQDFFFNNPYKNRQHRSASQSSYDDNPLIETGGTGLTYNHNNTSTGSLNSNSSDNSHATTSNSVTSTVIRPKPLIRHQAPQSNLSDKKQVPEEPQLSSLRIRRLSHRRDTLHGHGLFDTLDLNKPSTLIEQSSENQSESFMTEISSELGDIFGYDPNSKLAPFGGFSRPHNELLEKHNLFSVAPWSIVPFVKGNGSLFKAVESFRTNEINENFTWIGTVSTPSNALPDTTKEKITSELKTNYNSDVIFFDDEEFRGHYHSFCKEILWPIFHYQIPDNPKSNAFENHSWKDYESINRQFAEAIAKNYKEGDTVWVHDYHLMLLPACLRKLIPNAKIGFFLHISFPSSEVFRCLAQRKRILEGLLGADCISFQTEEYVGHFLQSCNRLLLADFDDKTVYYKGVATKVSFDPIGLSFENLNKELKTLAVLEWRKLIRQRWNGKLLIVNRDKIDSIRGIKEKLLAYERFLDDHPLYLNLTTMILICLRSGNVDEDYENGVFSIVERINSKTNRISDDQPVVLLHQDIEFDQYLALLSEANIFIVSTLREGMNLTCHEFICSTQELHSPLILSEFVGSADVLTRGPILINPYNIRQVSEAIYKSLIMPDKEKTKRWKESFETVLKHDSNHWVTSCLNDLNIAYTNKQEQQVCLLKPLTIEDFKEFTNDINEDVKKLYILNLDHLTSNLIIEEKVIHSVQQQLINTTLSNLTNNKKNLVYILSYYQRSDLVGKYKRVQDLGFIAENGGYIKPPHQRQWYTVINELEPEWMNAIIGVMSAFSERIPGSYIDANECTVKFHVSGAKDIDIGHQNSLVGDLITHINELYTKDFNIHATLIQGTVIVQEKNLISRAMSFILDEKIELLKKWSTTSVVPSPILQPMPMSPALSSISTFTSNGLDEDLGFEKIKYGFVMACGGSSHVDEEVYEMVNEIEEDKENKCKVLSSRVGQIESGTCAKVSLQGINELMLILKEC